MKTAFVLSGGGAKGAFQVGVIQRLVEQGIKPDLIMGSSVGAINSAGFAHLGVQGMKDVWLNIKSPNDIISLNWWNILWAKGVYSTRPLRKLLDRYAPGPYQCEAIACMTNLQTGAIQYVSNKNVSPSEFLDAVQGSASMPFIMEPINNYWVDGGVREQTPLKQAILQGADTIYVILCGPPVQDPTEPWVNYWPPAISYGIRALGIMEHEVFINDLKTCLKKNNDPNYKKINIKIFAPDKSYIDTLQFEPDLIKIAIQAGYDLAGKGPIQLSI